MGHVARVNPCVPFHYSPSYSGREVANLPTYCECHLYDVIHSCLVTDDSVVEGSGSPRDESRGQHSRDGDGTLQAAEISDCKAVGNMAAGNLTLVCATDVVPAEMTLPSTP